MREPTAFAQHALVTSCGSSEQCESGIPATICGPTPGCAVRRTGHRQGAAWLESAWPTRMDRRDPPAIRLRLESAPSGPRRSRQAARRRWPFGSRSMASLRIVQSASTVAGASLPVAAGAVRQAPRPSQPMPRRSRVIQPMRTKCPPAEHRLALRKPPGPRREVLAGPRIHATTATSVAMHGRTSKPLRNTSVSGVAAFRCGAPRRRLGCREHPAGRQAAYRIREWWAIGAVAKGDAAQAAVRLPQGLMAPCMGSVDAECGPEAWPARRAASVILGGFRAGEARPQPLRRDDDPIESVHDLQGCRGLQQPARPGTPTGRSSISLQPYSPATMAKTAGDRHRTDAIDPFAWLRPDP